MTKTYEYKGFRYFYCRHYRKWIVDTNYDYIYLDNKNDVIEYIDLL